jgi:hypothetical protein
VALRLSFIVIYVYAAQGCDSVFFSNPGAGQRVIFPRVAGCGTC